jgi:hypothetical protein
VDRSDFPEGSDLRNVEVGDADPAKFARLARVGQSAPTFFDVFGGPVDLVKVDGVDFEAAKAGILRTPAEFPVASTDGLGAETEARDVHVGASEFSSFHANTIL